MNVYNVQEVSILIRIKFVLKLILSVLVLILKQVNVLTVITDIKYKKENVLKILKLLAIQLVLSSKVMLVLNAQMDITLMKLTDADLSVLNASSLITKLENVAIAIQDMFYRKTSVFLELKITYALRPSKVYVFDAFLELTSMIRLYAHQ